MSNVQNNKERSQLKFITCGSVDDGKSTLIGHILYDAKKLYVDQIKALELDSKIGSRGGKLDYSLLLDGLIAEREQGITIDVAYRYFNTDKRSFIVADTPGHEEYTRNMAVGASFADLAVILLDATKGVLAQTRRHTRICKLMGIQNFVFAINKMDLVGYEQARYQEIEKEIKELAAELKLDHIYLIPLSATEGDNVITNKHTIPWYEGQGLLEYLEEVDLKDPHANEQGFYLPIQRVCRPNHEFRGFQGQIESGEVRVGDLLTVLPSSEQAHVKSIHVGFNKVDAANKGQPVTIELDKEIDISRGCVLEKDSKLQVATSAELSLFWMDEEPLVAGKEFFVKLGTKFTVGKISEINYTIDINTGEQKQVSEIKKNEIAACRINLYDPIVLDRFDAHKTIGELILINRVTNMTSACAVVKEVKNELQALTNQELRDRLSKIEKHRFFFNKDRIKDVLKFLEQIERKLLLAGIQAYAYDYESNEAKVSDEIIHHLSKAGVVVLVANKAEQYKSLDVFKDVSDLSVDQIFNLIKKSV